MLQFENRFRADPALLEILVDQSLPTLMWMQGHGVRFLPAFGRQSFKVDGRNIFWGGLTIEPNPENFRKMTEVYKRGCTCVPLAVDAEPSAAFVAWFDQQLQRLVPRA